VTRPGVDERNFCARQFSVLRLPVKNWGPAAPNHRESLRADSLIFDRIRRLSTLACEHLCKIFRYIGIGASSVIDTKRSDPIVQILFRNCAKGQTTTAAKILISSYFLRS
jgi:hypothetical protein